MTFAFCVPRCICRIPCVEQVSLSAASHQELDFKAAVQMKIIRSNVIFGKFDQFCNASICLRYYF